MPTTLPDSVVNHFWHHIRRATRRGANVDDDYVVRMDKGTTQVMYKYTKHNGEYRVVEAFEYE